MRVRFACVNRYWRYQVSHRKQENKYTPANFFMHRQSKNLSYIKSFYDTAITRQQCLEIADTYTRNKFCFLGSQAQQYTHIPWHTDFRLQQQNSGVDSMFDNVSFYSDLRIQQGTQDTFVKDIKVPWELSRFQYLYVLGKAYEYTNEQQYIDSFQFYVTDWLDNNPYLCGINWQCPMEVGIRAINWIVAWEFFNPPSHKCYGETRHSWTNFRERFISSLYDHMIYLENNWEYYDSRTNNHYLSNLVAYLYLCWFLSDLPGIQKKRAWVVQEILREFEKQVFPEGTSYEGSTHYHSLVTELFYHAHLLFQEMNISMPKDFQSTLSRMFDFINWCTINDTSMISVGDNDSGKVLYYGLTCSIITQMQTIETCVNAVGTTTINTPAIGASSINQKNVAYFAQFGLSIVKTDTWHITLRHHTYNALQPSGHFHNDVGSITLAVNGIPIIVDPGSFVYTASATWRNYFRSVAVHNTSFITGIEPVPLHNELFVLRLPECIGEEAPTVYNDYITLHAAHNLYERLGLQFIRQLDVHDNGIHINDIWISENIQKLTCSWNFTLAADIIPHQQDNGWLLMHHQTPLILIQSSDVVFTVHDTWVSPAYGQKVATYSLRASRLLDNKNVIIKFLKI